MCANRVEELEERVKELEASIEGLTDELVECKVRIRELENAVDTDNGFEPADADADGAESPDETSADTTKSEPSEEADETESESDIIVA